MTCDMLPVTQDMCHVTLDLCPSFSLISFYFIFCIGAPLWIGGEFHCFPYVGLLGAFLF